MVIIDLFRIWNETLMMLQKKTSSYKQYISRVYWMYLMSLWIMRDHQDCMESHCLGPQRSVIWKMLTVHSRKDNRMQETNMANKTKSLTNYLEYLLPEWFSGAALFVDSFHNLSTWTLIFKLMMSTSITLKRHAWL